MPTLTTLLRMNTAAEYDPQGSALLVAAGDLFGTAISGGAGGSGAVFEIVEFAKDRLERGGVTVHQAADEAARTRYRSVMMTALAFIVGVIPLAVASGAGAGGRQSIGTTVFGGMILASFIGVLFVPMLFVGFEVLSDRTSRLFKRRSPKHPAE